MPFQTPPANINPKKGSLIVCAGTVSVPDVASMGSGFFLFKSFFYNNTHIDGRDRGWKGALQNILNDFFIRRVAMPAYIRIAKTDDYLGGIATF